MNVPAPQRSPYADPANVERPPNKRAPWKGRPVPDTAPIPVEWTVREAARGVRVMTWNIRSGSGSWGGRMRGEVLRDIIDAVARINPDVIVMQEVDRRSARTLGRDLAAEIALGVGAADWAFAHRRAGFAQGYGHVVITRNGHLIEDDAAGRNRSYVLPLTTTSGIQRIADVSAISTPSGARFTMVGTHLSSANPTLRDQQAVELAAAVDAIRGGHAVTGLLRDGAPIEDAALATTLVLAGDFNAMATTLRRPGSLDPDAHGLTDVLTTMGVPLRDPRRVTHVGGAALDHMFVAGDAHATAASVLHAPRGSWYHGVRTELPEEHTSDHDSLVADIVLGA